MSTVHESEKFGTINLDDLSGVQTALALLDCDPGEIDGIDGPKTRAAAKQFQENAGLDADGIVGPKTREALKNALDQLASA
jgi:peptidoglycan hydrolase-like protein with peptidoglycan-binding domain